MAHPGGGRGTPFEDPEFRRELAHELADILNYLLRLSRSADIDLLAAAREKLALNEQRYPVELARGNALKYDRLTESGEQA